MKRWKQVSFVSQNLLRLRRKIWLHSSFASSGVSWLWCSILTLRTRGLFLTDCVKPNLWQRLGGPVYSANWYKSVRSWKHWNSTAHSEKHGSSICIGSHSWAHLCADKEKSHNFRLFGAVQCITSEEIVKIDFTTTCPYHNTRKIKGKLGEDTFQCIQRCLSLFISDWARLLNL